MQSIIDRYAQAVYDKNLLDFLALYSEQAYIYDTWDHWSYASRDAWAENIDYWFKGLGDELVKVDYEVQFSEEGENFGVVVADMTFRAMDKDLQPLRQITNRFSFVLKKIDGEWKIIHEHSSLPVGMDGKMQKKEAL